MKKTYIQPTINVVVVGVKLPLAAASSSLNLNSDSNRVDGSSAMSSSFSGGDDGEDW